MTIHEYLNNPMGKGNAAFLIGQAKSEMISKFLLDEDKMKVQIYDTKKTVVFHFEMPSKSSKGVIYDIVLEFPYKEVDFTTAKNIFNFPFKVYSNCPSFVYTYAYIFNQNGLIIDWLKSRYDKKTLQTPPTNRNRLGVIFYEHSVFNAVYYIFKNLGIPVSNIVKEAKKVSMSQLRDLITPQADISNNTRLVKDAERQLKAQEKAANTPIGSKNEMVHEASKPTKASKPKGVRTATKPKGATKPSRPR